MSVNFRTSVLPTFCILKLFGLSPFCLFQGRNNPRIVSCKTCLLYNVILLIVFIVAICMTIAVDYDKKYLLKAPVLIYLSSLEFIGKWFVIFATLLHCTIHRRKLADMLCCIEHVVVQLGAVSGYKTHNITFRLQLALALTSAGVGLSMVVLNLRLSSIHLSVVDIVALQIESMSVVLLKCQTLSILFLLAESYRVINRELETLCSTAVDISSAGKEIAVVNVTAAATELKMHPTQNVPSTMEGTRDCFIQTRDNVDGGSLDPEPCVPSGNPTSYDCSLKQCGPTTSGSLSESRMKTSLGEQIATTDHTARKIPMLLSCHDNLCDICDGVQQIFGLRMLFITAITFLDSVTILTVGLSHLLGISNNQDVVMNDFINVTTFWTTIGVLTLVLLLATFDYVSKEAKRSAVLVHKLINTTDSALRDELVEFSKQLLHRKVTFTACGFFTLDFTLLYSFVGSVTTYLVILVQFQNQFS